MRSSNNSSPYGSSPDAKYNNRTSARVKLSAAQSIQGSTPTQNSGRHSDRPNLGHKTTGDKTVAVGKSTRTPNRYSDPVASVPSKAEITITGKSTRNPDHRLEPPYNRNHNRNPLVQSNATQQHQQQADLGGDYNNKSNKYWTAKREQEVPSPRADLVGVRNRINDHTARSVGTRSTAAGEPSDGDIGFGRHSSSQQRIAAQPGSLDRGGSQSSASVTPPPPLPRSDSFVKNRSPTRDECRQIAGTFYYKKES